jgi:nicotinamide riboside transporter PnuC
VELAVVLALAAAVVVSRRYREAWVMSMLPVEVVVVTLPGETAVR